MPNQSSRILFPALVVDGSGSGLFVGILQSEGRWLAKAALDQPPLESLFSGVASILEASGVELSDIESYIYCSGPGSVLGLRLCAMAIETWSRLSHKPVGFFGYQSLQLCAASLRHIESVNRPILLVSDWKKGAWNSVLLQNGQIEETKPMSDEAMSRWEGQLYHLPQRKGWQSPPPSAQTIQYDPSQIAQLHTHPDLLRRTEGVELYLSGLNTFQKWTPERHRSNL